MGYSVSVFQTSGRKGGCFSVTGGSDELNGSYKDIFKLMERISKYKKDIGTLELDSTMENMDRLRLRVAAGQANASSDLRDILYRKTPKTEERVPIKDDDLIGFRRPGYTNQIPTRRSILDDW